MTKEAAPLESDRTTDAHSSSGHRKMPVDGHWSWRSLILAGPLVGLLGGTLAGLAEPAFRLRGIHQHATASLWLEAFSFSLISYVVAWTIACTLVCLLGAVIAVLNTWWRTRVGPGPLACAGLLVALAIVVFRAAAATLGVGLAQGLAGLAGALVVALTLLTPMAWLTSRFRGTAPGQRMAAAARVAAWPALALTLAAVGFQCHGRSRILPADNFRLTTTSRPTSHPISPPNVLLVVFDTLRVDRLGCYGYSRPTSSHIDAVAADAAQFTRAISPAPWTAPAHASIFTGLYRSQHGVGWDRRWLDDRFVTLAECLRDRGYQTVAFSNNPSVSPGTNLTQGFERFVAPYRFCSTTRSSLYGFIKLVWAGGGPLGSLLGRWFVHNAGGHATTSLVAEFLRTRDRSRPFFLFVNYMESHWPYEPERAYRKAFLSPGDLARSYRIDQSVQALHMYSLTHQPSYSRKDLAILSDLYDARIRQMDDDFADLIRALAAEVDLDDVLIILTADHGENIGDHELLGHNFCVYNTLLHVPLIIRWPRSFHRQRVEQIVQTNDLFPTVLDWVGVKPNQLAKVMARPLGKTLRSSDQGRYGNAYAEYLFPPEFVLKMVQRHDPTFDPSPWFVAHRTVFDGRWKLIARSDRRDELYDLQRDPAEEINLITKHRREGARLHRMLAAWRRSYVPFDPNRFAGPADHRLDGEQLRRLRDLGYVH